MKKLSQIKSIWVDYPNNKFITNIAIIIRYITAPFEQILDYVDTSPNLVLDIGCGHGLLLQMLKRKYSNLSGIGIDHDSNKILIAKSSKISSDIKFLTLLEFDQLPRSKFDIIFIIDVLYCIPQSDWDSILELSYKSLKFGGKLIIKDVINYPYWKYLVGRFQEIIAINILKYTKGKCTVFDSPDALLKKLTNNGFNILSHKRLDAGYIYPHYLYIAER